MLSQPLPLFYLNSCFLIGSLGHCLDHIRQYVMCAGDLTPIPTRYTSAIGRNFAFSDAVHTCRNFQSARNWLTERTNGSTAVKAVKQNEEECEDDSH